MIGSAKAREFQTKKSELLPAVLESFERLKAEADLVLVEGAGSASEINLRANDIANLGFAARGRRARHFDRRYRSRRRHRQPRRNASACLMLTIRR